MRLKRQRLLKSIGMILAAAILVLGLPWNAHVSCAEGQQDDLTAYGTGQSWIIDRADLLDEEEEQILYEKCQLAYDTYGVIVAVVTVDDFGGGDILEWQKGLFAKHPFPAESENGIMLAVSMSERDWGIQTIGSAQRVFNTYGREHIGGVVVEKLSDGDYYEAFAEFADLSMQFLAEADAKEPYSEEHPYRESVPVWLIIAVAFVLSLVISTLIVNIWKKGMNTRVVQNEARQYLKPGSFQLTRSSDIFLYHPVSRTPIPKSDNNSSSSMHSTSSGTSGKF